MPTYSEITIQFDVDFAEDYTLNLTYATAGVPVTRTWTWANPRTVGFEVSTGTALGTVGERTANNFETAYDIDLATGYITTQTVNSILIQSETDGEDFVALNCKDESGNLLVEGTDYTVTYNNYGDPFSVATVSSMLVRSPHYVTTPFYSETTTKVTIEVRVWSGSVLSPPADATQTLTITRPTTDYTDFNTNIADIVANYLESQPALSGTNFAYNNNSIDSEVKWVTYIATYTDPVEQIADVTGTFASSYGYSQFLDGINTLLPDGYLTSSTTRKVSDSQYVLLPYKNNGYYSAISVTSQPSGTPVNNFVTTSTSNESTEYIRYVQINTALAGASDTHIDVVFTKAAGGTDTVTYNITEECRYTPKTVVFKNRYGFYDCLTMFAKNIETLNVENEMFNNQYVNNGTYDITRHQMQTINIMAKETITCNSGYINEAETQLYKEMLISDYVWFLEGTSFVPVRPNTKSLTYKTRINDSLVQYAIDFDYAYNTINNV